MSSEDQVALFRECVKEYFEIQSQISNALDSIKEVRRKKDELGQIIQEFMKDKNYEVVVSNGYKLSLNTKKKLPGLKEDLIMESLRDLYGTEDAAKAWTKIMEKRESNASISDKLSCRKALTKKD